MKRILSTYLYVNQELSSGLLGEIAHAGISAIELFCTRRHMDYCSPPAVRGLAEWLDLHRLSLHSVHSPTDRDFAPGRESGVPISISDTERLRRLDAVDEIKRALDVAERVPFRYLIQHLGVAREPLEPRRTDAAFNSLEHLVVFAKQRGVIIALENTPSELAAPSSLRRFIHDTRLHDLRLCFDTGHAHLGEGVEASFEVMRDLVVTAHVHDNHGEKDEHLLPYEGTIDWSAALKALAAAPQELPLVLELKEPTLAGAAPVPLDRIVAALNRLENTLEFKGEAAPKN